MKSKLENRNPNGLLPTKIIKRQTVVLQSRFDQSIIYNIPEKLEYKLFTRLNFLRAKSSEIKLTSVEKCYEQYIIVKGKYSLDDFKTIEYNPRSR